MRHVPLIAVTVAERATRKFSNMLINWGYLRINCHKIFRLCTRLKLHLVTLSFNRPHIYLLT